MESSDPLTLDQRTWWQRAGGDTGFLAAYLSMEFGVRATLPIYAGGLGVLAGDHLKAAADLGIPLVGVGLLYRGGYFQQELDDGGGQVERYSAGEPSALGLVRATANGAPLTVTVELAGEPVAAAVWRADVGGVPLYLLDSDVAENDERGRGVTATLYGGDREQRIRQELLLGVGGVRALAAFGLRPTVFHLNEGHAAFSFLERLRALVEEDGLAPDEALTRVRASTVFTTHTPVPAGNELFDPALVRHYVGGLLDRIELTWEDLGALAQLGDTPGFGMTPLALRTATHANGVSQLHGDVARRMWAALWPERTVDDVPIGHVTNGVHAPTWLGEPTARLLTGAGVRLAAPPGESDWHAVRAVDDAGLWRAHRAQKEQLLAAVRARAAHPSELDPDALTIGFARRFATYKRAGLLFSDPERLARLLADADRPVRVLVAGKAHPADEPGKALIRVIAEFARSEYASGRVVFLADYDMALASLLVAGVDVWLNTPRPPQEACGTSGMKAALNGVLNVSTLDGWWWEAYAPDIGWAIGGERAAASEPEHDALDSESLYRVLEEEVVPAFYERDERGLPPGWLARMKASIERAGAHFTAHRMVCEYVERYYLPAHRGAAPALTR